MVEGGLQLLAPSLLYTNECECDKVGVGSGQTTEVEATETNRAMQWSWGGIVRGGHVTPRSTCSS